jgi:DNA-binding NarL/FixJ family response regulator
MSLPQEWLVFFFFVLIALALLMIYEIKSKFIWKLEAAKLQNENEILRAKIINPGRKYSEYELVLESIKRKLTIRQFEIFLFTIEGDSSKEIGDKLNISNTTIDSHVNEIKKLLGVGKRAQLASIILHKLKNKTDGNE